MKKSREEKRKAIIDDGCNPELVAGAKFDGILEIPIIEKPRQMLLPAGITPFTSMEKQTNHNEAIGFYEMDVNFADILINPAKYQAPLREFAAMISPDCSLYRNAPLAVQVANVYRNRAIGSYYQRRGVYVIPQIRWGNELTYTTKYFPEKIAFLGVEKHSIVAIGTYGCIQTRDDKYHFKTGLEEMLFELEPEVVLVYGSMPNKVFEDYINCTKFIQYDDWTTRMHKGGDYNG